MAKLSTALLLRLLASHRANLRSLSEMQIETANTIMDRIDAIQNELDQREMRGE